MSACEKDVADLTGASLRIRSMESRDVMRVWELEKRIYDFPWSLNIFVSCMDKDYENQVIGLGSCIIGYGVMQVGAGECHLLNLGVDSWVRGYGFGRSLLRSMLDTSRLQGAKRAVLEVRQSNEAARRLYAAENFSEVGLRRNYYPTETGREDALVLAKLL